MACDPSTVLEAATTDSIRDRCCGLLPLSGRLEPWMQHLWSNDALHSLIAEFGSPVNLIHTGPLNRHIGSIRGIAHDRNLDFQVHLARKANKCLAFASAARQVGAGMDVASMAELQQSLDLGTEPSQIICTAAIKDEQLIKLCVDTGVTISIDNPGELRRVAMLCDLRNRQASVALRLSGFVHNGRKLESRFGFDIDQVLSVVWPSKRVRLDGIHFHLDVDSIGQRVSAISQSLTLIDQLRTQGHKLAFLDIGGGFPIRYVDSESQWNDFCQQHRQALLGRRDPITYKNDGLGLIAVNDQVHGRLHCYPAYQPLNREDWFSKILDAIWNHGTVARSIRDRDLQLRCEPGRSLLDGCGMTVARIDSCKQHRSGDWLFGLSMNGTQCRTSHQDFLVDPLLIPADANLAGDATEGYLVGAYCMEDDLLLKRKLRFPMGAQVGDLIVFPNTAAYLMHFMESRSHQFPLAKNLVVDDCGFHVDSIDL